MTSEQAIALGLRRVEEGIADGDLRTPKSVLDYLRGYLSVELLKASEQKESELLAEVWKRSPKS